MSDARHPVSEIVVGAVCLTVLGTSTMPPKRRSKPPAARRRRRRRPAGPAPSAGRLHRVINRRYLDVNRDQLPLPFNERIEPCPTGQTSHQPTPEETPSR
jgi:hypothetical protein